MIPGIGGAQLCGLRSWHSQLMPCFSGQSQVSTSLTTNLTILPIGYLIQGAIHI